MEKPEKDPLVGTVLAGKYHILSRLSGGGMGAVYKAEHRLMQRIVAIKVLKTQILEHDESEEFQRRFEREAQTASRIKHPNAITIYDFGRDGGSPYLVMEFLEGRTLKSMLADERMLPWTSIVNIIAQVCAAATQAHKLGIIHRDVKPDNIMVMVDDEGREHAVVLDFGIAKAFSGVEATMTQAGNILGTPFYMSPEQVLNHELDGRSDIYSIAVMLYQMLAGDVPYRADSVMQLMMRHVNDTPIPISQRRPDLTLPPSVEQVVARGMAKKVDQRFSTATELAEALDAAFRGTYVPAPLHETYAVPHRAAPVKQPSRQPLLPPPPPSYELETLQSRQPRARTEVPIWVSLSMLVLLIGAPAVGYKALARVLESPFSISGVTTIGGISEEFRQDAAKVDSAQPDAKKPAQDTASSAQGSSGSEAAASSKPYERRGDMFVARGSSEPSRGQTTTAATEGDSAAGSPEELAEMYAARAAELTRAKRYDEAILACRSALQNDPQFVSVRSGLGQLLAAKGRFHEAQRELETALRQEPTHLETKKALCLVHLKLKHVADATRICKDAGMETEKRLPLKQDSRPLQKLLQARR